jgi:general secretion pathway protein B
MSFILDALKKSESDRQRQNGPALFEVRVAPPRTRLPLWAIAIALLLLLNLSVVMWMVLRHQARGATQSATTTAAASAGSAGAPSGTPAQPAAAPSPALAGTSAQMPVVATSAPASAGAAPPALTGEPSAPAPGAPTAAPGAEPTNAEDYAPAKEPAGPAPGGNVHRGTASGLPLYQDLSTNAGTRLPQLRLDLHVFAARPEDRFVMINMHKLREGDTLPEGVHLDSVTPEGAVLSFNGSKFLLPRD